MFLTPAEYARRRGVSRQAVHNAMKRGVIQVRPDGTIDVEAADLSWPPRLNAPIADPPAAPPAPAAPGLKVVKGGRVVDPQAAAISRTMNASRAQREAYAARREKLEYEQAAGLVVSAEDARQAAFNTGRRARDLLMAIPDRLSSSLAGRPAEEIHAALLQEIRHVCDEVGRWARL